MQMACLTEAKFAEICDGINKDRAKIIKHNPIGTDDEILLWMLLSVLVSYLSLSEIETPCFTGRPDAKTYRNAVLFILNDRREGGFDVSPYIEKMLLK